MFYYAQIKVRLQILQNYYENLNEPRSKIFNIAVSVFRNQRKRLTFGKGVSFANAAMCKEANLILPPTSTDVVAIQLYIKYIRSRTRLTRRYDS